MDSDLPKMINHYRATSKTLPRKAEKDRKDSEKEILTNPTSLIISTQRPPRDLVISKDQLAGLERQD